MSNKIKGKIQKIGLYDFTDILHSIKPKIDEKEFDNLITLIHGVCESNTKAIDLLENIKDQTDKLYI